MDPDDAGGESSDEGEREMVTETVSVTVRRQQQYQKKEGGEAETDRETAAEAQETAGARDQVEEDADLRDLLHHIGRLDDSDCGDLLDHFDQEETKLATDFSGGGSQQGLNQFGRLKNRFRNLRLGQKQKLVQLQTFDTTCEDEEEEDFEVTILSTCDLMTSISLRFTSSPTYFFSLTAPLQKILTTTSSPKKPSTKTWITGLAKSLGRSANAAGPVAAAAKASTSKSQAKQNKTRWLF